MSASSPILERVHTIDICAGLSETLKTLIARARAMHESDSTFWALKGANRSGLPSFEDQVITHVQSELAAVMPTGSEHQTDLTQQLAKAQVITFVEKRSPQSELPGNVDCHSLSVFVPSHLDKRSILRLDELFKGMETMKTWEKFTQPSIEYMK